MEQFDQRIRNVNKTWSKDLIIRYLVRDLAPYFRRDLNYFLMSREEQVALFNDGYTPQLPNIHCFSLCQFYQDLFKSFNIDSVIINANHGELKGRVPLYALIVHGDYGWYYINLLKDLHNHQLGISSTAFGYVTYGCESIKEDFPFIVNLPMSYINELDRKLNFALNDHIFLDKKSLFKNFSSYRISKGIKRDTPIEDCIVAKLQDISDTFINVGCVPGLLERTCAYKYFFRTAFTNPETKHIQLGLDLEEETIKVLVNPSCNPIIFSETYQDGVYKLIRKN